MCHFYYGTNIFYFVLSHTNLIKHVEICSCNVKLIQCSANTFGKHQVKKTYSTLINHTI